MLQIPTWPYLSFHAKTYVLHGSSFKEEVKVDFTLPFWDESMKWSYVICITEVPHRPGLRHLLKTSLGMWSVLYNRSTKQRKTKVYSHQRTRVLHRREGLRSLLLDRHIWKKVIPVCYNTIQNYDIDKIARYSLLTLTFRITWWRSLKIVRRSCLKNNGCSPSAIVRSAKGWLSKWWDWCCQTGWFKYDDSSSWTSHEAGRSWRDVCYIEIEMR